MFKPNTRSYHSCVSLELHEIVEDRGGGVSKVDWVSSGVVHCNLQALKSQRSEKIGSKTVMVSHVLRMTYPNRIEKGQYLTMRFVKDGRYLYPVSFRIHDTGMPPHHVEFRLEEEYA